MFWVVRLRRHVIVRGALLILLLGLLATWRLAGPEAPPTAAGGQLRPIVRGNPQEDRVALTFDVTWGTQVVEQVLAALEAEGVKATFFAAGAWVQSHPALLQKVAQQGHEVATLGMRMVDLTKLPAGTLRQDMLASQGLLERTVGRPARFFRPPMGRYSDPVIEAASRAGVATVTWSLDASAAAEKPRDAAGRAVKRARRGEIILMVASDFARGTPEAVTLVARGLKQRGFELVTLSGLGPG